MPKRSPSSARGTRFIKASERRSIKAKLYAAQGGDCALCGGAMEYEDANIDHIIPVALGGTNRFNNLQLAHSLCNRRRQTKCIVKP